MHDHDTSPLLSVGSRVNPSARMTSIAGADLRTKEANIGGEVATVALLAVAPETEPIEVITVPPEPRSS